MNWRNVITVWKRELRDQLRDRRTLFMVAVLPLLMYPLMGMTFFQLAQFMRSHEAKVMAIGAGQLESLDGLPKLIEDGRFSTDLDSVSTLSGVALADMAEITQGSLPDPVFHNARARLSEGDLDAVVFFPIGFADKLRALQNELQAIGEGQSLNANVPEAPKPIVFYNSARDASRLSYLEVDRLLSAWRKQVVGQNLAESRVPGAAVEPFRVQLEDVAKPEALKAGVWSKLLPFVVFVWALTGAFYPAVDLCAGEKERGTLETLLVSPASRTDIVWGKLLTVMTFSLATAILNLAGLGFTANFISQQLAAASPLNVSTGLGMPPLASVMWLVVALPPVVALFSALSFACAAFARSTKEGQYYFMPLFLATMPLMLMPLSPGVELNLGNSLAPVMGLVLLLRSLIEGDVAEAVKYSLPVTIVTFGCCLLAIRWAVSQFNQESVLFRGDDRFDLKLWLMSLFRRKSDTPGVGAAVTCVAVIFLLQFSVVQPLAAGGLGGLTGFSLFACSALLSQAAILLPAVVLALLLTRDRLATFGLNRAAHLRTAGAVLLAIATAVAIHPASLALAEGIQQLYPVSQAVEGALLEVQQSLALAPSPWLVLALLALTPAICEELTFRGFVLGGLRKGGSTFWAVVLSAAAFGAVHTVLQQSLAAALMGVLIGTLAVLSRSILPCMAFHATHNGLAVLHGSVADWVSTNAGESLILRQDGDEFLGYHTGLVAAGVVAAGLLLAAIRQLSALPDSSFTGDQGRTHGSIGDPLATNENTEG